MSALEGSLTETTRNHSSISSVLLFEHRATARQPPGRIPMHLRLRRRHSRTAWTQLNSLGPKLRCVGFLGPGEDRILMIPCNLVNQNTIECESSPACAVDYIDPLPMPLHEMIRNPNKRTDPSRHNTKRKCLRGAIQVSPSAHLAGR